MNLKRIFPFIEVLLVAVMASCSKDSPTQMVDEFGTTASKAKPVPITGSVAIVNLRTSGSFAILSKTGITDVFPSAIVGDVGSSPITGVAILLKCTEVSGIIYSVDAAGPLPCRKTNASKLTTAVGDMQTAYTDAAGRAAKFNNIGAGNLTGLTLVPGVYKWSSNVTIPADLTLNGSSRDVWIFQISGTHGIAPNQNIILMGGALAKNIFWQVAGNVTLGTTSHFEGIILSKTLVALNTGASINGRLLAQTAVTLQKSTVRQPK
jgi:hypothetical protein